jgi:hypothetical protein
VATCTCFSGLAPTAAAGTRASAAARRRRATWRSSGANGCPWDWRTCADAARGGQLEVLQWARANGAQWDEWTCRYAADGGHLAVLQWARANGCPWDAMTCAHAALNGHQHVLEWARANGCPWDPQTCSFAAHKGHLSVLQWARARGCQRAPARGRLGQRQRLPARDAVGRGTQVGCRGALGRARRSRRLWPPDTRKSGCLFLSIKELELVLFALMFWASNPPLFAPLLGSNRRMGEGSGAGGGEGEGRAGEEDAAAKDESCRRRRGVAWLHRVSSDRRGVTVFTLGHPPVLPHWHHVGPLNSLEWQVSFSTLCSSSRDQPPTDTDQHYRSCTRARFVSETLGRPLSGGGRRPGQVAGARSGDGSRPGEELPLRLPTSSGWRCSLSSVERQAAELSEQPPIRHPATGPAGGRAAGRGTSRPLRHAAC